MAKREINDPHIKALFAEISATRLILRALIEGLLPTEQDKAWEEINLLVARIDELAKTSVIGGADPGSSQQLVKAAAESAKGFVLAIGPKPKKQ